MKKVYGVLAVFLAAVTFLSCKVESSGGGGGTSEPTPELNGIELTNETRVKLNSIKQGDDVKLCFRETWTDGSTKDIDYNLCSSDFKIAIKEGTKFATIKGNVLSAKSAGSVKISVTYKEKYSTEFKIEVKGVAPSEVVLTSIKITPISTIAVGSTATLKVTATYSDGTSKDVSSSVVFESSNKSFATINGTTLTGVAEGEVTITATYEKKSDSIPVKVYKTVPGKTLSKIAIDPPNVSLPTGTNIEFKIKATYSNGDTEDVSKVAVCEIDIKEAGSLDGNKFTAASVPKDTIVTLTASYKYDGTTKTAIATITVIKDSTIPTDGTGNIGFNFGTATAPTKIEITSGTSVAKGGTLTLITKATYSNGTSVEVFPTYESSNTSVATVDGITLKGISAGTATITATYTEAGTTKTASVTITVTEGGSNTGSGSISVDFGS